MITFKEIDRSNYMECICLKIKEDQKGFVADNAQSLAEQAKIQKVCIPVQFTRMIR